MGYGDVLRGYWALLRCFQIPPDRRCRAMVASVTCPKNLSVSAPQMFEVLPERNPSAIPGSMVTTEVGEVWEKGPEQIVREGSCIRAIYSYSLRGKQQVAPGAGDPELISPSTLNAGNTQRSGTLSPTRGALDALAGDLCRPGLAPDRAGRADGQFAPLSKTVLTGSSSVFEHIQDGANSSSGGLRDSSGALWQAGHGVYTAGVDGGEGRAGKSGYKGENEATFLTDCMQSGSGNQVFEQFHEAAVFSPVDQSPKGHEGMLVGQLGSGLGRVRGGAANAQLNAGLLNSATLQRQPAAAQADLSKARLFGPASSVWGRSPNPSRLGGWSPDYREAFPSLHGND